MRALGATYRWHPEGLEHYDAILASGRQPIMAFWHGRILPATLFFRNRAIVVMISRNFDGEWISTFSPGTAFAVAVAVEQLTGQLPDGHWFEGNRLSRDFSTSNPQTV